MQDGFEDFANVGRPLSLDEIRQFWKKGGITFIDRLTVIPPSHPSRHLSYKIPGYNGRFELWFLAGGCIALVELVSPPDKIPYFERARVNFILPENDDSEVLILYYEQDRNSDQDGILKVFAEKTLALTYKTDPPDQSAF